LVCICFLSFIFVEFPYLTAQLINGVKTLSVQSSNNPTVRVQRIKKTPVPVLSPPKTIIPPYETNWPPDYKSIYVWRATQIQKIITNPVLLHAARAYYRKNPAEFINHWIDTYDPRNALSVPPRPLKMPFILFKRQEEFVKFVYQCLHGDQSGLIEKSRDCGATWLACAIAVHLYLFEPGIAIGFGSRKEELVDHKGNPDSILEKIRMIIRGLPAFFQPKRFNENDHLSFMRIINPETGATIIGEVGDNIGRGARKKIMFLDESAHYEHAPLIEAALSETTRCKIDISSVSGMGTVFHNKRESGIDWDPAKGVVKGKTNVFVFDWSEHPTKDITWYKEKRAKFEEEGLLAVFAQEIDRDYAAAAQGVIIPGVWLMSCIDAHKKLGLDDSGQHVAALDVADMTQSGDTNAVAVRKGIVLKYLDNWGGQDTGQTTRKTIHFLRGFQPLECYYDCNGVGAGVKSEYNRVVREKVIPAGIAFRPWDAGAKVLDPDKHVIPHDKSSPLNKDHFQNFKAQAWLNFRWRVERTHRAVTDARYKWREEELLSFDSTTIPPHMMNKLRKELSQPTMITSVAMKVMVDKQPEGMKSPNIAEAVVMCYSPRKATHFPKVSSYHLMRAKQFKAR
jgi:phage terminase large subunit